RRVSGLRKNVTRTVAESRGRPTIPRPPCLARRQFGAELAHPRGREADRRGDGRPRRACERHLAHTRVPLAARDPGVPAPARGRPARTDPADERQVVVRSGQVAERPPSLPLDPNPAFDTPAGSVGVFCCAANRKKGAYSAFTTTVVTRSAFTAIDSKTSAA